MAFNLKSTSENSLSRSRSQYFVSYFIQNYPREYEFHKKAASLAGELCQTMMTKYGIRAIVSHRAKHPSRLESKLQQRFDKNPDKYSSVDAIRNDIVDLAGVRIALYFPNDRAKVREVISETFSLLQPCIEFRRSEVAGGEHAFHPRFDGYYADHYRVSFKDDTLSENARVEIQVASVLMHAWAEVNHDLVYKTLKGTPSNDELSILDSINGLAHTGEVLLQLLQTAMDGRLSDQKRQFSDQYELRSFLLRELKLEDVPMGHLDILLQVLQKLKLDNPGAMTPALANWTALPNATSESPITLFLLEHILKNLKVGPRENETATKPLRLHEFMQDSPVTDKLEKTVETMSSTDEGATRAINLTETSDGSDESNGVSSEDDLARFRSLGRYMLTGQCILLKKAATVVDVLNYPSPSILKLDGSDQHLALFHKFYHEIAKVEDIIKKHQHMPKEGVEIPKRLVLDMYRFWKWFEENSDVKFRIALQIARVKVLENVVGVSNRISSDGILQLVANPKRILATASAPFRSYARENLESKQEEDQEKEEHT